MSPLLLFYFKIHSPDLHSYFNTNRGDLMTVEAYDQLPDYVVTECPNCGIDVDHLFVCNEYTSQCRNCGWDSESTTDDAYLFSSPL